MSLRALIATAAVATLGCTAAFQPRSANPYEPDRTGGPPQSSTGVGGGPAIAAIAGAQRRASGECFVPCLNGTTCNKDTGLCDPLPCRGACKPTEECLESGLSQKCVPKVSPLDLQIQKTVEQTPP